MFVSQLRYFTTARSALQETFLYQERFIYLFNSACIFSQSRSNGCQAYRTTLELIDNRTKYLIVYLIQTVFVNIQRFERKISDLRIDAARTFHLRKVPHAAQQSIGNTRRTPTASCNLRSSLCGTRNIQNTCRTTDDATQHIIIVIFQMKVDAKTGTQRSSQQTATGGSAH